MRGYESVASPRLSHTRIFKSYRTHPNSTVVLPQRSSDQSDGAQDDVPRLPKISQDVPLACSSKAASLHFFHLFSATLRNVVDVVVRVVGSDHLEVMSHCHTYLLHGLFHGSAISSSHEKQSSKCTRSTSDLEMSDMS